jgi:uncharacterized protein
LLATCWYTIFDMAEGNLYDARLMFTRPIIDSLEFARKGMETSGEVPMAELPRMAELLSDQEGKIAFVLRGLEGKDGKPMLALKLNGSCNLSCQRCLKPLQYSVQLMSVLRLIEEGELNQSDIEDDEVDNIPADKRLDVLNLLEEELLLSIPIAPKHEPGICQIATEGIIRSDNPFAVLAGLKK